MAVLVIAGVVVGFWLGMRYAIAVGTWTEHRSQRAKELKLRRARWVVWRAAFGPAVAVLAVLGVLLAGR